MIRSLNFTSALNSALSAREGKINGTCFGLRTLAGHKEAGTVLKRNKWWWSKFISLLLFPLGVVGPKCAAFTFVRNLEGLASFCRPARNVQELMSF